MAKGGGRTLEDIQNQIIGSFDSLNRKTKNDRKDPTLKLSLGERIKLAERNAELARVSEMGEQKRETRTNRDINDTWWSRGEGKRQEMLNIERSKLL